MKFLLGFAVLFASSMIFSCSEVSDPSPIVGIDEKLLVNDNGWVVSSSTKDDGKTKQDLLAQYSLCDADNVYKFQNDGEYTINEGDKKCETTDPQIKESGYWILKGSSLTFSPNGHIPYQFTISSLTAEELVFTYLEIGLTGIVVSVTTITFTSLQNA